MREAGYSLIELMFGLGLAATLGAVAIPQFRTGVDDLRAAGAARYLTTKLRQVRMEAVTRSKDVALQFVRGPTGYTFAVYVDENGDGVRTRDIQSGMDRRITPIERLPDLVGGVDFGVLPGLPPVESGSPAPGTDPIKLGSSDILTFTAIGTSSTGSLYLRSAGNAQYVVRVSGETGKTRVLKFDARLRQWKPQ